MGHFQEHSPGRSRDVHGPLSRTFTREVTSRPWIILKKIHQGGQVAFTDHFQEHSPGRSRHFLGPLSRTFTREAISYTESRNRKRDWAQYRPGVILNRMEERSGVNGRQLFVRVDRNGRVRTCVVSAVFYCIILLLFLRQIMSFPQWINKVVLHLITKFSHGVKDYTVFDGGSRGRKRATLQKQLCGNMEDLSKAT